MTFGIHTEPGRPPGTPNKATKVAREAIAQFVDGNADRLTDWLDKIAQKDPKQAFDCFMSVVEYHIPKLQRTENINKNIGIVQIVMEAAKQYQAAAAVPVIESSATVALPSVSGGSLNDDKAIATAVLDVVDAVAAVIIPATSKE